MLIPHLKVLLASEYVLLVKVHGFHWNIEGKRFFPMHKEFQLIYEKLFADTDLIAEQVRILDKYAPTSMNQFIRLSVVDECAETISDSDDQIEMLARDFDMLSKLCNMIVNLANEANNQVVVDLAVTLGAYHQKTGWMLRSYLK